MTDREFKSYVGEDRLPAHDLTDELIWEESELASQAYNGQSTVSNIKLRDSDAQIGPFGNPIEIATRNQIEAKLGSNFLWRGRWIGRKWHRVVERHDRARVISAEAEDQNSELRGIIVDNWARPAETDVARVQALVAAYLSGSPRATTVINGSNWVSGSNAVNLQAHIYKRTDPFGVLGEIAAISAKQFFNTIDHELFYDGFDSTSYTCPYYITDNVAELRADPTHALSIIPNAGPLVAFGGQQFLSGARVYYGTGDSEYVDRHNATRANLKAHWEEVVNAPPDISDATNAGLYADAVLGERSQDGRTFTLTVARADGTPLTDDYVGFIKPGMLIGFKSRVYPTVGYASTPVRIVNRTWISPGPGQWFARLQLAKPERTYGRGEQRQPRAPAQPTDPVAGGTLRLYMSNHESGEGASTQAQDDAPDLNPGSGHDAAAWDDHAAASEFYMLYDAPASTVVLSNRNHNAVNLSAGHYFVSGGVVELDGPDDPDGTLLAFAQSGGAMTVQVQATSRSGIGINESVQNDLLAAAVRIWRSGSGFIATPLDVTTIGDLKFAAQSTPVNRRGTATVAATPSAAAGDYLVVDFGFEHIGPTSGGAGARLAFTDTNANDLPEDQSTTSALNSWVEFTGTGSEGSPGDVPEPVGTEGAPGDETGTYAPIDHVHAHGFLSTSETRYHDDTHIEVTGTDGVNLGANVADALDLLASKLDGGTDGQVLTKQSGDDYDVDWETPSGGGGGGGGVTVLAPSSDTYINSQAATTNSDTETDLIIDNSWGTSSFTRFILMTFDISSLTGKNIGSAVLSLFRTNTGTSNATTVSVVKCLRAYVANQVTWNVYSTGNNWTTAGAGSGGNDRDTVFFGAGILRHGSSSEVQIDIARLLQRELDATETTLRIIIGAHFDPGDAVTFASLENATSAIRPQLRVVHD